MDAKILRKWGLKASDSKDSLPSSPVSLSSRDTRSATPVDVKGLQSWLPPVPIFERQRLSADVLRDLRYACAVILKETTPADADIDQTDPLEEYKKAIARTERGEKPQPLNVEQRTHKPRDDSPRSAGFRQSSKQHQPAHGVALHGSSREVSSKDRVENVDSLSGFPQPPKREPYKSTSLVNNENYYKPPPHKAASSDYVVHESSRTSTTNPGSATTASARDTAITSFNQSPHDTLRNSNHRSIGYPSNIPAQHEALPFRPGSSSQQGAVLTTWVTGGRSQREHEEAVAAPVLRNVESRSSIRSQGGLRSRAESIRDGIKEYIRPGSSQGSRSSSRPATSRSNHEPTFAQPLTTRPESRGSRASSSHENKRSWWKGGPLRRKGSVNSYQNSQGSAIGQEPASPAEEGPDLDKSLPPMPSLDSYVEPPKEPKETRLHISQLMVPIVPGPPANSYASPANLASPSADLRSPMSFHSAQNSPLAAHTPQLASIPPPGMSRSAKHSPALTPGGGFPTRTPQPEQRTKSSKTRSHDSSQRPSDRKPAEPSRPKDPPVPKTFYSKDHQSASADLTQFSDAWREQQIQELAEKRAKRERDGAERRLKRERERQISKEQKRRAAFDEKMGTAEARENNGASIKNRLSRMFGAKSSSRPPAMPTTETVSETMEPIEDRGRGQSREVIAN